MPRTRTVTPQGLSAVLRNDLKDRTRGVKRALQRAAEKGVDVLRSATPVDQGAMIEAWRVVVLSNGDLYIRNNAPHAGIIEAGARPHTVSEAGRLAIQDWAERHGMENPEAAAWGIVKKIEKEGSRAHWIVRDSLEVLTDIIHEELEGVE